MSESEFFLDKIRFFEPISDEILDKHDRIIKIVASIENDSEWEEIYSSEIDLNPKQKSFAEFLEKDSVTWCDTKELHYKHKDTDYGNFAKLFIAIK